MVRLTLNRSFREDSCCNVEVINGATGFRFFSFVPTDDYAYWCDFYGCFAAQGSETVSQGEVGGGLVIKF